MTFYLETYEQRDEHPKEFAEEFAGTYTALVELRQHLTDAQWLAANPEPTPSRNKEIGDFIADASKKTLRGIVYFDSYLRRLLGVLSDETPMAGYINLSLQRVGFRLRDAIIVLEADAEYKGIKIAADARIL